MEPFNIAQLRQLQTYLLIQQHKVKCGPGFPLAAPLCPNAADLCESCCEWLEFEYCCTRKGLKNEGRTLQHICSFNCCVLLSSLNYLLYLQRSSSVIENLSCAKHSSIRLSGYGDSIFMQKKLHMQLLYPSIVLYIHIRSLSQFGDSFQTVEITHKCVI